MLMMRRVTEFLLYALILGLPFEYYFRNPDQSVYTTLKLQAVLFLACWAIMKVMQASREGIYVWREFRELAWPRLLLALLLLVLSQIVAAAFAAEAQLNAAKAAAKTAVGAVIFIAAADLSKERRIQCSLLAALSLTGFCVAFIGLGELAGIGFFREVVELFQHQRFRVTDRLRFHSTMEYPNIAGHFLSAALFASLALITQPGSIKVRPSSRWVWFAAASFQAVALALTYSRGAVGTAIVGLATATWVFPRLFPRGRRSGVVAACLTLLTVGMANQLYVHYTSEPKQTLPDQRIARFGLAADDEIKYLSPGREYSERIRVRNESPLTWVREKFGVSYRWYELTSREPGSLMTTALFPSDLPPGRDQDINAVLKTPPVEGEYLLIWYVFERNAQTRVLENSFSPAIVCSVSSLPEKGSRALSANALYYVKLIREERLGQLMRDVPTRSSLWLAALRMFAGSPWLGIGPDNFRLLKWRYMELPGGDERILANSLYLEFLAGSGLLGLASLLWLLIQFGRSVAACFRLAGSPEDRAVGFFGVAYFTAFVMHGFVDYFLKFTPTFLLFWVTMGVLGLTGKEARKFDANRH